MLNVPLLASAASGVNVMLMVQVPPLAATVPTQLSVSAKLVVPVVSVSVKVIPEMVRAAVPSLVTLTVCTALRTFRVWFPKLMFCGTIEIPGLLAGSISATNALPATPLRLD